MQVKVLSQQLPGLAAQQCLTSVAGDRRWRKLRQKPSGLKSPTHQGGERNLGPQRRANIAVSTWLPREVGCGEMSSRARFPHGRRPMDTDEGNGPTQSVFAPAHGWWHQGNGQRPKAGKVSVRKDRMAARLADQVVVAMMPRDNITLAEPRTCGAAACLEKRGSSRHAFGPTGVNDRVVDRALTTRQTRYGIERGRSRRMQSGPAVLKPYWGKPAVRNFREGRENLDLVRQRSKASRPYSPNPPARFEREDQETGA